MNLRYQALHFHQRLPLRIWSYLRSRGIVDALIHRHLLGWNGTHITIPIRSSTGEISFFKLRRDPLSELGPKMLATPGSTIELYGWESVKREPEQLVICEGELDRLVLESRGFAAVTSTGGALSFRREWAEALAAIPEVYVALDNDEAGRRGTRRIASLLPHARVLAWPEEVGAGGDVTDFFVGLKRTREDFETLLCAAEPLPAVPLPKRPRRLTCPGEPIESLVARYVRLRRCGQGLSGRCPFHDDQRSSFAVYPKTGTFSCFACGARGRAEDFLTLIQNPSSSGGELSARHG